MTLQCYEQRNSDLKNQTIISFFWQYNHTIQWLLAQLLREVLKGAGIDVSIFSAHSVRGASVSAAAAGAGITTNDILKAADWSSESVF